jgi:hypothetical protein
MESSGRKFDKAAAQRLSELLNNLTLDEQRILARLLSDWKDREQREEQRTECSIVTEYIVHNRPHRAKIKNISLGGAFIESRDSLRVNQEISQSFFVPNFEIPIRTKSRIVWTGPDGFGVQFQILETD